MTEPTYIERTRFHSSVTLLVNPGTPAQRAYATCSADRFDQQANHMAKALAKYGADADLAWTEPRTVTKTR